MEKLGDKSISAPTWWKYWSDTIPSSAHMESVAGARTRLHFQSFGTTAKQKLNSCTPSVSRTEWIVLLKSESLKKKVMQCSCMPASAIISKISRDLLFCLQIKKRSSPLDCCTPLVHILGTVSNCCCTADVYRARLVHLHAWFFLLHGRDLVENVDKFQSGSSGFCYQWHQVIKK